MFHQCASLLIICALLFPSCASPGDEQGQVRPAAIENTEASSKEKPTVVSDELLVKFNPDVSIDRIQALVSKHSTTIKEVIKGINWYVLKIHTGRSPSEVVEAFKQEPEVEAAELQGLMQVQ